ncbi:hypothetical protein O181_110508 [Austropuccinia psidii MF-1]|uniref:Uncharacterized protein n=1 Tax=Austropuccinia psidii MF-1 TaxID=1389203 RepID=A0A9Q3JXX0_9BASI|nr:hypothetical protein [Austropuccinia psidii MF-1]
MNLTLELDTRYHDRQREKGSHQEKNPPVTGSNSSRPHHKKNKGKQFKASKDKSHYALLNKENKLIGSEKGEEDQRRAMDLFWWKAPN